MTPDATSPLAPSWPAITRSLAGFLAVAGTLLALGSFTPAREFFTSDRMAAAARAVGAWGPALLFVAGLVSPILLLPRWPIAFVAGMLYGVVAGSCIAHAAAVAGALLQFSLARSFLSPLALRFRARHPELERALSGPGAFLSLFLLRAFPLSSFVATNLLAGSLRIPLRLFFWASLLGMIPSTLMVAAWGKLMKKPGVEFYALAIGIVIALVAGAAFARRRLATRSIG